MQPDLSPHLHTDECNILIDLFKDCIKNVPLWRKVLRDECAYWNIAVWDCCHEERILRRGTNPAYQKRLVEHRRLPEEQYTPALKKLREEGRLILGEKKKGSGCSI